MPPINGWESGVYAIRNKINGKVYVGSAARSIRRRWTDHRVSLRANRHCNKKLQNAWNKYGESGFEFLVLVACSGSQCIELEQKYIDKYDSFRRGYNMSPTAGSRLGVKLSEETCKKFSATAKIAMNRPEVRLKLSSATKAAMSRPEVKERLLDGIKRGNTKPETRKNRSDAAKKCQSRPGVREKRAASLKGREQEISEKQRQAWKNPSRKRRAYSPDWSNPIYREKQSQAMKRGWAKRRGLSQREFNLD